jgi:dephospho-CoA kinase
VPLVIGLTGSIAAGKSSVAQILVSQGAAHCDADKLVHRLYDPGTPGFDRVVAEFGADVVGEDGYVDRKALGAKVFGKPKEMAKLTKAMGSISDAIEGEIKKWRVSLGENDVAVMEAVNLMEPGYARWCDATWIVGIDKERAKKRMMESRGLTSEEADQRLKSQRPLEKRSGGCDWVYINDKSMDDLTTAVGTELKRILALHAAGKLPKSGFERWWEEWKVEAEAAAKKAGIRPQDYRGV